MTDDLDTLIKSLAATASASEGQQASEHQMQVLVQSAMLDAVVIMLLRYLPPNAREDMAQTLQKGATALDRANGQMKVTQNNPGEEFTFRIQAEYLRMADFLRSLTPK